MIFGLTLNNEEELTLGGSRGRDAGQREQREKLGVESRVSVSSSKEASVVTRVLSRGQMGSDSASMAGGQILSVF